jgi:glycosyltransferase involved in cell wall biosynthesis
MLISLVTLGDPATPTGGYLYHRRMAEAAPQHGASIAFVSLPSWPFPLPLAWGAPLRGRTRSADVVVLDSIAAAQSAPWLPSRRQKPPVVAMLHQPPGGIDHGMLRSVVQRLLDRWAYSRADRLLVASHALADEVAVAGIPRSEMIVVPPGRDVASRADTVGDLRRGRAAAVLCVGNWVARKGILELLEALARLDQRLATLHLVGDGRSGTPYGNGVRCRVAADDLSERVVVHGVVPPERVAGMYRAADAFVLPSVREPYGTVYGEAMAEGLPVVGWNAGNLPYLATDGREGFVLAPGDIDALSRALERLCSDEALRQRMAEAARHRARSLPTWADTARAFFGAIRAVIAG